MNLNDKELQIIKEREFLLLKADAISKIRQLFTDTRSKLETVFQNTQLSYPNKSLFKTDKISKGENYLGFPYLILDYPAIFSRTNIFAFRTMFWWGNYFSVTLHLQGKSLDYYRKKIIDNIPELIRQDLYIAIGDSPWEYIIDEVNYPTLNQHHIQFLKKCKFLKLSKKIELDQWQALPSYTVNFFRIILDLLV